MNKEFIGMLIGAGLNKTLANSVAGIVDSEFKSRMKKVDDMVAESIKSDLKAIDGKLYEAIKSDLVKLLSSLDEQYEKHLQTSLDEQKQEHKEEFKSFLKGLDTVLSKKYGKSKLTENDNEKVVYANKEDIEDDEIKDLTDDGTKVVTEEDDDETIEIPDMDTEVPEVPETADIASEDVDEIDELEVAKELLVKAQEEIETLRNEIENGNDEEEGDAFDEFENFDEFEDYAEDSGFEGEDGDLDFLWERRDIITSKESLDSILKETTEKFKNKRKKRIKENIAIKKSKELKEKKLENKIKNIDSSDVVKNKRNVATLLEGNNFSNRYDDIYIPTKYL